MQVADYLEADGRYALAANLSDRLHPLPDVVHFQNARGASALQACRAAKVWHMVMKRSLPVQELVVQQCPGGPGGPHGFSVPDLHAFLPSKLAIRWKVRGTCLAFMLTRPTSTQRLFARPPPDQNHNLARYIWSFDM
jgi:hypothetical protein